MADHKLDISSGKPELGAPSLSVNPPADKPVEEQPKPEEKQDAEPAGPAEDKD